ncbi:MAG: HAMP domain-containing histidine kinase [Alphaproteobacteria bacterium]|nr:HAMP domain-containing histidine kinase [Alphaproteobacteria bacterium SS10]
MLLKPIARSLSLKLLVLTVLFVLLAEVLIFAPSIGRYRLVYFQERLDQSYLATLVLEADADGMLPEVMQAELLGTVGAHQIMRKVDGQQDVELAAIISVGSDQTYDLREAGFVTLILDAFATLATTDDRVIDVIGEPTNAEGVTLKIRMDEAPLRQQMIDFSVRIFWLSLFISIMAALLVFLALRGLLVTPLQDMVRSMIAFRDAPESDASTVNQSGRIDEMGLAERELAVMQDAVRQALRQKTRLALLGTAVAKINHDLRNILSTAALLSERLSNSQDEQVAKVAPRLETSINRAIDLCSETLKFSQEGSMPVRRQPFQLMPLLDEIGEELVAFAPEGQDWYWNNTIEGDLNLNADREQLYRVIANLGRNAFEAGAVTVSLSLAMLDSEKEIAVEIEDDGPGLPPRAKDNLFVPFAGSTRGGGTGLGLTIAREIVRAHGGDLTLEKTDGAGTRFRIRLPNPRQAASNRATPSASAAE